MATNIDRSVLFAKYYFPVRGKIIAIAYFPVAEIFPVIVINTTRMKKVTGIGGIFFKCQDPDRMNEWYKTHLGMETSQYGASFEWRHADDPEKSGSTQWSAFAGDTKYFEPSSKDFMINYRVDNLEALVAELQNTSCYKQF